MLTEATVQGLKAAVATDATALSLTDSQGRSVHARVLSQVILDSQFKRDVCDAEQPFHTSLKALRWLLRQQAPYLVDDSADGPGHAFVSGSQWADNWGAPVIASLMKRYIELGLVDVNAEVLSNPFVWVGSEHHGAVIPLLRASLRCGNFVAAQVLLEGGASEAKTLEDTGFDNLLNLSASYADLHHWPNEMAATIIETQMTMRIARRPPASSASATPARRRNAPV